jgi:hypothetical protein
MSMATITFATEAAHALYHSMAEGMSEVRLDDGDMEGVDRFDALLLATGAHQGAILYPLAFTLPASLLNTARDVLDNCLDNREGGTVAAVDIADRHYLIEGEVTITPDMRGTVDCLPCAEAIETILDAIETMHCVEGIPEELQPAVKTLYAILAQRGCEDFAVWGEYDKTSERVERYERLTSVMDCVIYG